MVIVLQFCFGFFLPTCCLRNLCAGQEATVRIRHGKMDCFQIGQGAHQSCKLSPCLFIICRVHRAKCWSGWSTSWNQDCQEKKKKIARRNISNLRYADDTTLIVESEEELKRLLRKVKEESKKAGLKLNIHKTNIMASSPITSWHTDVKQWKQWQILFSWAPKSLWTVTAAIKLKDAYSLEEKLWQISTVLKSRDLTLPVKVCIVRAAVFPVVMYGCES